jgi:Ca2+-binding EF-hand superfamily protein
MLQKLGKAEKEDMEEIIAKFKEMDVDGSGFLDQEDFERAEKLEAEKAAAGGSP